MEPVELMYMLMGFFGSSYCRYSSSAIMSSVTAGTNDMPCNQLCFRYGTESFHKKHVCCMWWRHAAKRMPACNGGDAGGSLL